MRDSQNYIKKTFKNINKHKMEGGVVSQLEGLFPPPHTEGVQISLHDRNSEVLDPATSLFYGNSRITHETNELMLMSLLRGQRDDLYANAGARSHDVFELQPTHYSL